MDILDALAIEICNLIESKRFARLSGYFGNRCYVFGRMVKGDETRSLSLPLPGLGRNSAARIGDFVLMIKVQLDQDCVSVSSRISVGSSVSKHSDWYNKRVYGLEDPGLFDGILRYAEEF